MNYRLMVISLRFAVWLATRSRWHGCAKGILKDAEGDSGYGKIRNA